MPPKKVEGSKLCGRTQVDSVSSAAVSAGDYFHSFGESPFGSNLLLLGNRISRAALGHRTTQGGSWGAGTAIRTTSAPDFAPPTHTNVSLMGNRVSLFPGQSALQAVAVAGLVLRRNSFDCSSSALYNCTHLACKSDDSGNEAEQSAVSPIQCDQ